MNNTARQLQELQQQLHSKVSHLYKAVVDEAVEQQMFFTHETVCGLIFGELDSVSVLSAGKDSVTYFLKRTCKHTGDVDTAKFRVKDSWNNMTVNEILADIMHDSKTIADKEHTDYVVSMVRNLARLDAADRKYVLDQFIS